MYRDVLKLIKIKHSKWRKDDKITLYMTMNCGYNTNNTADLHTAGRLKAGLQT